MSHMTARIIAQLTAAKWQTRGRSNGVVWNSLVRYSSDLTNSDATIIGVYTNWAPYFRVNNLNGSSDAPTIGATMYLCGNVTAAADPAAAEVAGASFRRFDSIFSQPSRFWLLFSFGIDEDDFRFLLWSILALSSKEALFFSFFILFIAFLSSVVILLGSFAFF